MADLFPDPLVVDLSKFETHAQFLAFVRSRHPDVSAFERIKPESKPLAALALVVATVYAMTTGTWGPLVGIVACAGAAFVVAAIISRYVRRLDPQVSLGASAPGAIGDLPGWVGLQVVAPKRIRRYVTAALTAGELEVYDALADELGLSVDQTLSAARSL